MRPLHMLNKSAQRIIEGHYHEEVPYSQREDEIGQLQNRFRKELAEESVRKKTIFIQNLSHKIRTPLNVITGFANILLDNIYHLGFLDSYSTSNHDRVRAPSSSGDTSDGDAEEIEGIANEYIRRQ